MSILSVYDNATDTWNYNYTKINSKWMPFGLAGSATQVDHGRKLLYAFGGYYLYYSNKYSYSSFFMLDLERNVWIYGAPEENSEIQVPISVTSAAVINNTYFVNLFGNGFNIVNAYTITNIFYFLQTGMRSDDNVYLEPHTIDILDLRHATNFNDKTYENQTQPINWLSSTAENSNNSTKNKVLQYIGLICTLSIAAIIVGLFLYFKRKNLPVYWHELKKSILWNPR
jgi:hypothetical protein